MCGGGGIEYDREPPHAHDRAHGRGAVLSPFLPVCFSRSLLFLWTAVRRDDKELDQRRRVPLRRHLVRRYSIT